MAADQWRGGIVAWLVLLSAVSAFLLVENGILRDRLAPPSAGEVLLVEARMHLVVEAEGHTFVVTGGRLAGESRLEDGFVPSGTWRDALTPTGGCVWLRLEFALASAANNLTSERLACTAGDAPLVAIEDGLGGRWIVTWRDAQHADAWGDARHFGFDQGQEVTSSVFGQMNLAMSGTDSGIHYGPWTMRGSITWINHGSVAWRAS